MAKLGRNQPCPCGSGRKVKRCCGTQRGPSPEDLAWQALHDQARKFAALLRGYDELDIDQLLERVIELPVRSLVPTSPPPPNLALQNWNGYEPDVGDDTDDIVDAVQDAAATIDGPHLRLTLASEAAELCRQRRDRPRITGHHRRRPGPAHLAVRLPPHSSPPPPSASGDAPPPPACWCAAS